MKTLITYPQPSCPDIIAEVRDFISQEMQFLENAEDVDTACAQMLERCLQFKHARNPAMAAIIHYLRNIVQSDENEYYKEYKDQIEPCANIGFLESDMN